MLILVAYQDLYHDKAQPVKCTACCLISEFDDVIKTHGIMGVAVCYV